ncbi:MAG: hypothetical protein ACE5MG_07295 [Candidatus Methylomirabilales bacterium]
MRKLLVGTSLAAAMTLLGYGMALGKHTADIIIPTDAVYKVQIIAFDRCPKARKTSTNGKSIFLKANYTDSEVAGKTMVELHKTNKIFLAPGDFKVLDGNACDGNGARFQLPADSSSTYEVYVRLVGKPHSGIDVTTCAVDTGTGEIVCSTDHFVKVRYTGHGQPHFTNATKKLLYMDGTPLFDADYEDFFWNWNTQGRPHAQMWFVHSM